jgi:hypothetical protein
MKKLLSILIVMMLIGGTMYANKGNQKTTTTTAKKTTTTTTANPAVSVDNGSTKGATVTPSGNAAPAGTEHKCSGPSSGKSCCQHGASGTCNHAAEGEHKP